MPDSDAAPERHEHILHLVKWSKRGRPYGNTKPLKSSVLKHPATSHPEHGAVFPMSLVAELLRAYPPEAVVFDPYIGSGTIAAAAAPLGFTVHGFDLECSLAARACPGARLVIQNAVPVAA